MKKRFKVMSLVIVIVLSFSILSGCTITEKKVYNAITKMQKAKSYESDTYINWNIDVSGLSDEEQLYANEILAMINNSNVSYTEKMSNNIGTDIESKVEFLFNIGETSTNLDVWVNSDTTASGYEFQEIIKIPNEYSYYLPEKYMNKDYFIIDSSGLEDYMNEEMGCSNFSDSVKMSYELKEKFIELMDNFVKDFDFHKTIVKSKGTDKYNDESVKVYELKLDDQTCKEFLHYSLITLLKSEGTDELITEYINYINDMISSVELGEGISDEELLVNSPDQEILIAGIDKFFDDIKDIPIIGDEGLVIEFKINNKGYIVGVTADIHMVIDVNSISNQYAPIYDDTELPVIDIKLNIEKEIRNINEDIEIEYPLITRSNSFTYSDLLNDLIVSYEEPSLYDEYVDDETIYVYVDKQEVYFDVDPFIEDEIPWVPLKPVAEALGFNVKWDEETQSISCNKENYSTRITLNDVNAELNNDAFLLDFPPRNIDGITFVPISFISNGLGAEVYWYMEEGFVIIESQEW